MTTMHFFNKLEGLKFLKKTGVEVLPWRAYRHLSEAKPEHFPNAQRILVRTDLTGNNPHWMFRQLPRKDSTPQELKKTMQEMKHRKITTLDGVEEKYANMTVAQVAKSLSLSSIYCS
ncbi:hypothetical protein HY993_00150 [Candidatus Micrarchaeota archaeon]|nr:hypothetical protein [Candidatus Micrarchaeota archaeon]